ncbi:RNA-directed DNA polymerase, eukaryota, nucleotide-binding alpha-beta plait domain protein [Tanacetum coccineum]
MRLTVGAHPKDVTKIREFTEWILKVKDGELGEHYDGEVSIDQPGEILINAVDNPVTSIIDFTYPNILYTINDPSYFQEKEFDFGMSLMGRAKYVSAIPNLPCIISKEGFQNVKLSYIGGMWVLFEFDSLTAKEKFLNHSGIGSWFTELIQATSSFENDERIVWISIEELDAWFPNFQEDDHDDLSSDGESQKGDVANKADNNESDVDRVSNSSFMHENDTAHKDANICKKGEVGSHPEDPFNIYGILDGKKNKIPTWFYSR